MWLGCVALVMPPSTATDTVPGSPAQATPVAAAARGQSCPWHRHRCCSRHWGCTGRTGALWGWGRGEEPSTAGGGADKWVEPDGGPCSGRGLVVN